MQWNNKVLKQVCALRPVIDSLIGTVLSKNPDQFLFSVGNVLAGMASNSIPGWLSAHNNQLADDLFQQIVACQQHESQKMGQGAPQPTLHWTPVHDHRPSHGCTSSNVNGCCSDFLAHTEASLNNLTFTDRLWTISEYNQTNCPTLAHRKPTAHRLIHCLEY